MTPETLIVVAGGLTFGLAGAIYARLSRWRLEQGNAGIARGIDPRQGPLPLLNRSARIDASDRATLRDEKRALERRLLWKIALVAAAIQAAVLGVFLAVLHGA